MDLDLKDRAILVTGASQGLGAEIAHESARRGARAVALVARSPERGEAVARAVAARGIEARFFAGDLAQPHAAQEIFSAALAWAGEIDGLVNAAGATTRASLVDGTADQFDALFALNVRAPFLLMQAFARHRMERGAPGAIVNILSMNAHCGSSELALYSATKGALATLTRNAANAHLADRIRVNGINMGWAATDGEEQMQAETLGKGAGWAERAAAAMPLARLLTPQEVARLTVYLLSDYSGLQTGTCIDLEQRVVGAP